MRMGVFCRKNSEVEKNRNKKEVMQSLTDTGMTFLCAYIDHVSIIQTGKWDWQVDYN